MQGYRGDIQGLRALAVLLVALDHAAVGPFDGGFIGVDVFFVISGYLITSLLIREADGSGRVSLRDFYARRARRILPAAMLVILATVVLSVMFLDGASALLVGEQAMWATFFAANVKFALETTDYFAADQAVSPLQHYWSLAVEEQFYLVWPLVLLLALVLVRRRRDRQQAAADGSLGLPVGLVVGVLAGTVALASFAWSLHVTATSPLSAYFSTTARAWELAVGALLAVGVPRLSRVGGVPRAVASWAGLALIVGAAVLYSAATPFPGWAAVAPVAGAALLLAGGLGESRSWGPQRGLSLRPVRALGDWSYSFYLWHWPLIVVVGHASGPVSGWRGVAVLTVAVALSAATYRLVETPFRTSRVLTRAHRGRLRSLMLYPAMVLVVLPTVAAADHAVRADLDSGGEAISTTDFGQQPGDAVPALGKDKYIALVRASVMAARNDVEIPAGLDPDPLALRESIPDLGECDYFGIPVDELTLCPRGDVDADRTLVVLGDSHARMWVPALERIAETYGYRAYYLVLQGCPGLDQTPWQKNGDGPQVACEQFQEWAADRVAELEPDLTVVATDVDEVGYEGPDGTHVSDDATVEQMAEDGIAAQLARLEPVSGRTVVLGDPPQRTVNPNECLTEGDASLRACLSPPDARSVTMLYAVRRGTLAAGGDYIGTVPWFCFDGTCPTVVGDRVTHRDLEHVTIPYADWLAPELARRLGLT